MRQSGMIPIHNVGVGTLALVGVGIDATKATLHALGWVHLEVFLSAVIDLKFVLAVKANLVHSLSTSLPG